MRSRSIDLLLVVASLLSLSATVALGNRDYAAAAVQQQRQAVADACEAQASAAVHQAVAYRAADPTGDPLARSRQRGDEVRQLREEQQAIRDEMERCLTRRPDINSSDWQDLLAETAAHQRLVDAALKRSIAGLKARPLPVGVYLAETSRLNGNSTRLLARQATLRAAVAAAARPPSPALPWAAVLTVVLPPVWVARTLWFRRRRRARLTGHRCVACDYDLRASPDRCPECGTVPAAASRPPVGLRPRRLGPMRQNAP